MIRLLNRLRIGAPVYLGCLSNEGIDAKLKEKK